MKFVFYICVLVLSLLPFREVLASGSRGDGDSLRVSLLTCEPGKETYELYGHTALRVTDFSGKDDWVFNYGVFDFKKPGFVWRFALGQTDYELGVVPFSFFVAAYEKDGRGMVEQELNLSHGEKERLYRALIENYKPGNREYRYNFLYDNCTTRAIRQIEDAVEGKLLFAEDDGGHTFRSIIHEFAGENTWESLGPDLVLGNETDKAISVRQCLFSPIYARRYVAGAYVEKARGGRVPLVAKESRILSPASQESNSFPLRPLPVFLALLVLALAVSVQETKGGNWGRMFDVFVMLLQGCAGLLAAFLFFFSEHPAVGSNWLLVLLNPLPLFFVPGKICRMARRRFGCTYEYVAGAMLLSFWATSLLDVQKYPAEMHLLALILLIRLISTLYMNFKSKRLLSDKIYAQ